jgi:hypothetical protein
MEKENEKKKMGNWKCALFNDIIHVWALVSDL